MPRGLLLFGNTSRHNGRAGVPAKICVLTLLESEESSERDHTVKSVLSVLLWPLLFIVPLATVWAAMPSGHGVVAFNATYLLLGLAIAILERIMPHERTWLENDGQILPDLLHTVLNKGVAQVLITVIVFMGIAEWAAPQAGGIWPAGWPLVLQLVLGLVIVEFPLYWKHRLAHEWPWLWRFHAVHHSVTRLWFFNTGRFHLVDTLTGLAVGIPLLLLIGAPEPVLLLVSAVTAFIGLLTHCNIEMRCGVLNYVFNTPALHRWHHSKDLSEGNMNYGENLVLYDLLFGSFYNSPRRPPRNIGISQPMPDGFFGQLKVPFTRQPL